MAMVTKRLERCPLCDGQRCRVNPFHRPNPALSNVVDSTGHWAFPFILAPMFAVAALFAFAVVICMVVGRLT